MRDTEKIRLKMIFAFLCLSFASACGAARIFDNTPSESNFSANAQTTNESANNSASSKQKISPAQAVAASATELNVKAGETATAEITVQIADGFHINTNPADSEYLRPMTLKIASAEVVKLGEPIYPPGEKIKFAFADAPLSVYTNRVKIKIPVSIPKNAKPEKISLPAKFEAQPCNNNACFPPRTIEFNLPVNIIP